MQWKIFVWKTEWVLKIIVLNEFAPLILCGFGDEIFLRAFDVHKINRAFLFIDLAAPAVAVHCCSCDQPEPKRQIELAGQRFETFLSAQAVERNLVPALELM